MILFPHEAKNNEICHIGRGPSDVMQMQSKNCIIGAIFVEFTKWQDSMCDLYSNLDNFRPFNAN